MNPSEPLPAFRVQLLSLARRDIVRLDKPIRERVSRQIDRLGSNPLTLGKSLSGNLANCREVHVAHRYRIVYTVAETEITVLVIAVGKRENLEVYRTAAERLANLSSSAEIRTAEPN